MKLSLVTYPPTPAEYDLFTECSERIRTAQGYSTSLALIIGEAVHEVSSGKLYRAAGYGSVKGWIADPEQRLGVSVSYALRCMCLYRSILDGTITEEAVRRLGVAKASLVAAELRRLPPGPARDELISDAGALSVSDLTEHVVAIRGSDAPWRDVIRYTARTVRRLSFRMQEVTTLDRAEELIANLRVSIDECNAALAAVEASYEVLGEHREATL